MIRGLCDGLKIEIGVNNHNCIYNVQRKLHLGPFLLGYFIMGALICFACVADLLVLCIWGHYV